MLRRLFGLDDTEYATSFFFFYLAYVVNDPHFAVTYLLFYRKCARRQAFSPSLPRAQRLSWILLGRRRSDSCSARWLILALRTHSAQTLGWMVQLMYLLVGWHYVKQGFGVLTVLSARRGIRVTQTERRVVLFHCFAGWAYAWASPAVPRRDYEERGIIYTGLAHPRWFELASGTVLAASTALLIVVLVMRKRRTGQFLPLAPLLGLLASIWSWTVFSAFDPLVRYAIPALHSLQYLYFVRLLRRNEARALEGPPHFGRPVAVRLAFLTLGALALGWIFFHGAPELFDTAFTKKLRVDQVPDDMGTTPYGAALYVFVNLHHYFMDHVIWRRENPETQIHASTGARAITRSCPRQRRTVWPHSRQRLRRLHRSVLAYEATVAATTILPIMGSSSDRTGRRAGAPYRAHSERPLSADRCDRPRRDGRRLCR